MATTFEDYVTLVDSDPALALSKARLHLAELMKAKAPRVGDMATSHDSSSLDADIDRTRKDIDSLRIVVTGAGRPQFVPMRRVY
jgi:hypothetical protein